MKKYEKHKAQSLQSQAAFTIFIGLKRRISGLAARVAFHHRNDIRVKLAGLAGSDVQYGK